MSVSVESMEFRKFARANCYKYECLEIYIPDGVVLDDHNFPNYKSSDSNSSLEKFITTANGLANSVTGVDSSQKLARPMPTVKWDGDEVNLQKTLSGTMYFLDYDDYKETKKKLRNLIVNAGWKTDSVTIADVPFATYEPKNNGQQALYGEDPVDAAGRGMLVRAMQHTEAEANIALGYMIKQPNLVAKGVAKKNAFAKFENTPIGGFGFIGNIKAGLVAMGANTGGGLYGKWLATGSVIEQRINGKPVRKSINFIMQSANFKESAFIFDGTNLYPTQMSVDLSLYNAYGAMISSSTTGNK